MSMDKTLRSRDVLQRHRNVLTRAERIAVLRDEDRWTEHSSVLGLPKVAHRKAAVGKKDKAVAAEAAPGAEGAAAATPAAAPAAKGAAPAPAKSAAPAKGAAPAKAESPKKK